MSITNEAILEKSRYNRYYAINFNSYNIFKTVEFRIFPGVKTEAKLKKYLMMLLNFINSYLQSKELEQTNSEIPTMPKAKNIENNFVEYVKPASKNKEIQIVEYLNNEEKT